ncbi:MAG: elongation factor G [Planctomycetota bacterium]|nr:elongation factor G [Planctomycetota bacterium]
MGLDQLRNIGIVAHIDAGKTTVTERMLFYSGVERRMGEVHEGTATMDWMEEERKRGITIVAAATTLPWRDHTINLIDTPGHVDFTVEVERSMRVLDGAVLVLNGVAGVQAQSETVWRQMRHHDVPYIAFVNQCDRAGADYMRCVGDLRRRLGAPAIAVQYPLGVERGFRSLVDVITGKAVEFAEEDLGREPRSIEAPPEVADEVAVLRAELIEALAEEDEGILQALVEEREPDPATLRAALRKRVVAHTLVPVLCGAALRNVGIQPLLDAVIAYLPAPTEVPPIRGKIPGTEEATERPPDADGPTCALAFKLAADPHEDLTYVRIYSGRILPGKKIFNPRVRRMERISRVLRMHADHRTALDEAGPGDIVALTGCKLTGTGDTLCSRDGPIVLEKLEFPEPVITRVVEPKSAADRDKLHAALDRLAFEDPSFHLREDEETGQWLIAGMGELHLEIKQHRLEQDYGLEVRVGQPRVAYREAALTSGRGRGRVERVLGGKAVFGAVDVELQPVDREVQGGEAALGAPPSLDWAEGCGVPAAFRPAVEDSLLLGAQVGPRFGFPLVNARLLVTGGESRSDSDSELGFIQAANLALRKAMQEASIALIEPLMAFEIEAPDEFMSGVIADLNAHKANITEVKKVGALRAVSGTVPLFGMFGYSTTLRSLSQGRASFFMEPAGFRPVPEEELEARGLVWH